MPFYTGVGSRKTPPNILNLITDIAIGLRLNKLVLRSGGAEGADTAFQAGARGLMEIYYAKDATPKATAIAEQFHPNWKACSEYARKLHGRNTFQVLGKNLETPSNFLICWTPDGCSSHSERSIKTGGTGTAISIASFYNIPIHNLMRAEVLQSWTKWLEDVKSWTSKNNIPYV